MGRPCGRPVHSGALGPSRRGLSGDPGALPWIVSRVDSVDETQGADVFNSILLCDDMNSC